jgi:2-polyprenyl-3-methyl-5-hydroxy-6-metoxy-1,4-benzoquinol methylase
MVYVQSIINDTSIISEQTVDRLKLGDPKAADQLLLNEQYWETKLLKSQLQELDAITVNAHKALDRIEWIYTHKGHLLDFGCGWGFFLSVALQRGWTATGLEPLPVHAAYARKLTGAPIISDVLHADSFKRNAFDVVTCFQVLEHLTDPKHTLQLLYEVVKPGGIVFIEVPNISTWSVRIMGKRHRHFVADHLNFFARATLSRLVKLCGYEPIVSYNATRYMSFGYLINHWGRRYINASMADTLARVGENIGLNKHVFSLNIGDILTVIARRTLSNAQSESGFTSRTDGLTLVS